MVGMRKLREGKGKVVLEGKVVIRSWHCKEEIRCPKEEEERGKTGGEKSKDCQAGLLVRRAVYV